MTASSLALDDPALARVLTAADVRPEDGLQLLPLDALVDRPFDPGVALVVLPPRGTEPASLPGRHAHDHDPTAVLTRLYPADHPVITTDGAATIAGLGAEGTREPPFVLPALDAVDNTASLWGLAWLVARLRAPDGCPWDREQGHLSLRPFLLEETYEVYDALEGGATPQLAEELGDLLLQIVLHAQYGAEAGVFDLTDVHRHVMTKIIGRHPHVFGDVEAATADDVMRNWEQLKADERAARGETAGDQEMPAAFAGLSVSLPALAYADEMQARAASLGYDWPDLEGVIDKVAEEASELMAANEPAHRAEEFGDLLFVLVNLGRKLDIDPEAALRAASRKFASRFARVERLADEHGLRLKALGLDALDELWQEAKREESSEDEVTA